MKPTAACGVGAVLPVHIHLLSASMPAQHEQIDPMVQVGEPLEQGLVVGKSGWLGPEARSAWEAREPADMKINYT